MLCVRYIADEYLSSPIPSKYDWVRDVIVCGVALDRVRGMEKQERAWNIVRYRMDGHRVGWVSCDYGKLGFVYIRLNQPTTTATTHHHQISTIRR